MKQKKTDNDGSLKFLYNTVFGRVLLKLLTARTISVIAGKFLDSRFSKPLIKGFVTKKNINLSEFYNDGFNTFNECFSRKIREEYRPIDMSPDALVSPCDGLLSAYKVSGDTVIPVKQSRYSVTDLLRDESLAEKYRDGICLVFRLCVNHYHRYCYPQSGLKSDNIFINGRLHTVRPIALRTVPVFIENCREYTLIDTEKFGTLVQIEVGAMLVGKIKNFEGKGYIEKGREKGMFLYGGSTVILLLEKDKASVPQELFNATENGIETSVVMGQKIATIL